MASRKDQLQSYQFMMQRVVSSVVLHEADPEQAPLRRGVGAVFLGVMLTGLLAIAFGVYAVISGNSGTRWQQQAGIVIEKETGAHYVYENGVLQPVLNYTSALLISGSPEARRVPGRNLSGVQRGVPVGILGAPDSLPPPERVVGAPWTLCSVLEQDPAGEVTTTLLVVGDGVPGAEPLDGGGILVRDSEDGTRYLVWRSHRYHLGADPEQVIRSLYGAATAPVAVGAAWLNGLPAGPDIGPIEIPGRGEPSAALPEHTTGDVLVHSLADGQQQYYVVFDDGLAHVSELQVRVLAGRYAVEPRQILPVEASEAPTSDALAPVTGDAAPPPAAPALVTVPTSGPVTFCAETADAQTPPLLTLGGDLAGTADAIPTNLTSPQGNRLVDLLLIPPGHAAVVRTLPSGTAEIGSYQLVTDVGLRYPVPSDQVLAMLGYSAAQAVPMPAALVQRIPAGPTLDPAAALQPVPFE